MINFLKGMINGMITLSSQIAAAPSQKVVPLLFVQLFGERRRRVMGGGHGGRSGGRRIIQWHTG